MIAYAKNPAELALIANPQNSTKKPMKKTTKKRKPTRRNPSVAKRTKDMLIPAAGILGGMVAATQVTRMVSGFIPESLRSYGSILIPVAAGVALTGMGKSSLVRYIGIGAGAAGVSAGVRKVMPSIGFVPMAGQLADALNQPAGYLPAPTYVEPVRLAPPDIADSQFIEDSGWMDDNDESGDSFSYL
jgi:hypothetical protein